MRATVEPAMRAVISSDRREQVVRLAGATQLLRLLASDSLAGEVPIEEAGDELVPHDCLHPREAHVELAPLVVGGPVDGSRRDLGLVDRRHREVPARAGSAGRLR